MTIPTHLAIFRIVVLISLTSRCIASDALGLGPLQLHSALGQPLQGSVQVIGAEARKLADSCVRSRLSTPDGSEILRPDTELRRAAGGVEIAIASTVAIEEPAVTLRVETTCSPILHRDYRLLLDMRDGLPHVLAQPPVGTTVEMPSTLQERLVGLNDGGTDSRRGARGGKPGATSQRSGGPDASSLVAVPAAVALMGAVDVPAGPARMKMSQADFSPDRNPSRGMRMSDTLSPVPGSAADEPPPVQARAQTHQQARASGGRPAKSGGLDAADGPGGVSNAAEQSRLSFNKWLIGLAVLLLASVGVLPILLRSMRHGAGQAAPWWMLARGSGAREAELLQSARISAASRKKQQAAGDHGAPGTATAEDKVLERYVQHFVRHAEEAAQPGGRMEPLFQAGADDSLPQAHAIGATAIDRPPSERSAEGFAPPPTRSTVETFALVSDVMQEAEFWRMLNETQRAVDILEHYCSTPAADSPLPWMYLADIYAGCGEVARHARLAEGFCTRFNGRLALPDETGADAGRTLEDYPHVLRQITEIWNQPYVLPFLQDLLFNRRDTPRYGFDLPVYKEILLLVDVAREREGLPA